MSEMIPQVDHSKQTVSLPLDGELIEFGRFLPRDALQIIGVLNARYQKAALEAIPTASVAERVEVFKRTANRYGLNDLDGLMADPDFLAEVMYACYRKAHPDCTTWAEWDAIYARMDLGMLQAFGQALTGLAEADDLPNAQEQAATTP